MFQTVFIERFSFEIHEEKSYVVNHGQSILFTFRIQKFTSPFITLLNNAGSCTNLDKDLVPIELYANYE